MTRAQLQLLITMAQLVKMQLVRQDLGLFEDGREMVELLDEYTKAVDDEAWPRP